MSLMIASARGCRRPGVVSNKFAYETNLLEQEFVAPLLARADPRREHLVTNLAHSNDDVDDERSGLR